MSIAMRNGRALKRKVDITQKAIVSGLRQCHFEVYEIEEPADLLVYHFSNRQQRFVWTVLDVKTPLDETGRYRQRSDQLAQQEFLARTRTAVVTSLTAAIEALEAV
jgi:hypothetical protein